LSHRNPDVSFSQFRGLEEVYVRSLNELLNGAAGVDVSVHATLENDQGFE